MKVEFWIGFFFFIGLVLGGYIFFWIGFYKRLGRSQIANEAFKTAKRNSERLSRLEVKKSKPRHDSIVHCQCEACKKRRQEFLSSLTE